MVISNLKEAGEGLISDADNHPNSDKEEIKARQGAALDHWHSLRNKHRDKSSALSDLEKLIENLATDVGDVAKQSEGVDLSPDNVITADKKLDKLLKDIAAMFDYVIKLEHRIQDESDDHSSEEFLPLAVRMLQSNSIYKRL